MIRLALIAWLAFCGAANAQLAGGLQFPGPGTAHSTSAAAAYVNRGAFSNPGDVGNTWTQAVDIGTASATRLVVVGIVVQNNPTLTVSVNSTPLTRRVVSVPDSQYSIWSGTVPTGSGSQSVDIVGGNFLLENMVVWTADGLASNSTQALYNSGGGTATLNVNAGDFIFAVQGTASFVFTGSTETPAGSSSTSNAPVSLGYADWTVASTNASFSAVIGASNASIVAATFR